MPATRDPRKRDGAELWSRKGGEWKACFRLPNNAADSWIMQAAGPSGMTFGCIVCRAAHVESIWSNRAVSSACLQKSVFQNHAKSMAHKLAVSKWSGEPAMSNDAAPPRESFEMVLRATREGLPNKLFQSKTVQGVWQLGLSLFAGGGGAGGRRAVLPMKLLRSPCQVNALEACAQLEDKKVRCIKWCLAEAVRSVQRERLRDCRVASIHQDGRQGRLAIRYTACGEDLKPRVGVLGSASLAKDFRMDAVGMSAATVHILRSLCTSMASPPHCRRDTPPPVCDEELLDHVRGIVELFDADAASDEQLCGKLLGGRTQQPSSLSDDAYKLFHNLRIFNKDRAHASRRTRKLLECGDPVHVTVDPNQ